METVTVKQIHNAFDSASESLIDGANAFLINYDEKLKVIAEKRREAIHNANAGLEEAFYSVAHQMEKAKTLRSLGFTGTSEVAELTRLENQRAKLISDANKLEEKEKRKYGEMFDYLESQRIEHDQVIYYKEKYPFLKFITDEQLDWLCKKYSLVYAPVGNYTGNVPDKNMEEIAMYGKISLLDLRPNIFHYEMDDIDYGHFSLDSEIEMDVWELKKHCKKYGYDWIKTHSVFRTIKEDYKTLYIAADKSLFNLKELKKLKNGFGFFKIGKKEAVHNLDPIVFRYVKGGVLVISKWGDEANDAELVVPELN